MSLNVDGYKKDLHPLDEQGMKEIKEKKQTLADALFDYFGDEVKVEDVIALSQTIAKARAVGKPAEFEDISISIRNKVRNLK